MKVCNILAIGCLLDVIHLLPLPFYPVWKLIGSEAFMGCTTGSLLGFDIPADTKGMTIGNHCFMGCESLVTFSTANDSVEIFETGLDLLTEHGIKTACRNGWTYFPIHKLCYHSSRTTMEDLAAAIDSCDSLEDTKGMAPFHIVATTPKPRVEIVQCLLDSYPLMVLEHTDNNSTTMMD